MFNIIELLGIIVVAICAIIAFKKGFVKTFFGFISTFLAIILAFVFCNLGVSIIKDNTGIDEWLEEALITSLNAKYEESNLENSEEILEDVEVIEDDTSASDENNVLTQALENLPQNIKDVVGLEEQKEVAKKTIIENSIEIILKILSWIIIYLVVRIVLMIICFVFNGIMNIPFLKQINNLAGLFLGIILGLFRIYVALTFISFLVSVTPLESLVNLIKDSMIISVMYENNILISLIF